VYTDDKPVGIVTFQCSLNEGSQVQAWAMKQLMDRTFGKSVIVDYFPVERMHYQNEHWDVPKVSSYSDIIGKQCLSPYAEDANAAAEWIDSNCTAAVFGSDEIWRFQADKHPNTLSLPNIYFGNGVHVPKAAYAVSIGESRLEDLSHEQISALSQELQQFCFIGVRDEATHRCVSTVVPHKERYLFHVPDPTFGVQLPLQKRWTMRARFAEVGLDISQPIAVLIPSFRNNITLDDVAHLTLEGYQVASMYDVQGVVSLEPLRLSPLDWFAAIAASDFVVTTRMHGLIAALIGNVPVAVLSNKQKLQALVSDFSLPTGTATDIAQQWSHDVVEEKKKEYYRLHQEALRNMHAALARTSQ